MIWWVALLPALSGLAIWCGGDGPRLRLGLMAAAAMAATFALAAAGPGPGSFAWADRLTLRAELVPLSGAVAVVVPLVALAVVVFAAAHEAAAGLARLLGLLLIFTGAMQFVVIAGDLLTLLIGWELMGACSWALIGHRWREERASRSANYAFVMTRAGDLGLFIALFACFAGAGSVAYSDLGGLAPTTLTVAAFGLLVAAAAKAGQVPFAPWLFRAMDGPTSVSSLLHSSTMVAAGAFLLARLHPWIGGAPGFAAAAVGIGLATALAGGLVAAMQMHAKRLLAGSTSAQLGLMFAAVGAGYPGVAVLHLIAHAAFKAPLFFAAGIAEEAVGSFDLRRMRLGRALAPTAALSAVPALALAGVPPLGGAWSKEQIVAALADLAPGLAVLAMVAGGLSAAYAARFWIMAYWPGEAGDMRAGRGERAALGALALATLLLSALWWPPVHEAVASALGLRLPPGGPLEFALSLVLVALGLLAGLWLARHPAEHRAADWLGLPALVDAVALRPGARAAAWAADVDDRRIDGMNRGAGHGGVALLAYLGEAGARVAGRLGERAVDLLPTGTGRVAGMAGADARRLQSGMAHHYYVFVAAGAAAGAILLLLRG